MLRESRLPTVLRTSRTFGRLCCHVSHWVVTHRRKSSSSPRIKSNYHGDARGLRCVLSHRTERQKVYITVEWLSERCVTESPRKISVHYKNLCTISKLKIGLDSTACLIYYITFALLCVPLHVLHVFVFLSVLQHLSMLRARTLKSSHVRPCLETCQRQTSTSRCFLISTQLFQRPVVFCASSL